VKYCLESISKQDLTPVQFQDIEVIVIDGGSNVDGAYPIIEDYFRKIIESKGMKFKMVRTSSRISRSDARNLGLQLSKSDIIIFLDGDVILHKDYISETLVRHQFLKNIVLVGFKENISVEEARELLKSNKISKIPNISKDFRVHTERKREWTGLFPSDKKIIRCLEETNYFKDFGFNRNLGPFNLACMVVTHNVSVRREEAMLAGGFDPKFEGWGLEDTHFGAKLIARGNYIIPLLSTGVFHISTETEEKERKIESLRRNYKIMYELLNSEFCIL